MTAEVVTSENLLEFQMARIPPRPEPAADPEAKGEAKGSDKAVEAKADKADKAVEAKPVEKTEKEAKPEDGPLQRRFSELARERKDAEQKAEREAARAEAAEAKLREHEAKLQPKAAEVDPDLGPEPDKSKYADAFDYARDMAKFEARKIALDEKREAAQQARMAEAQKVSEGWKGRVESFRTETPDYEDTLASSSVAVHDAIRDAIIESDFGPQILYALAKDDELAKKFAAPANPRDAGAVMKQLRALGRLEATFDKPKGDAPTKVEAKEVKRAPEPITAVRGGARTSSEPPSNGSFADYKAWRENRRPH